MNVEKIFQALNDDAQNSALGIICAELEIQGYSVVIDGVSVTSDKFYNNEFSAIEKKMKPLDVSLIKNGDIEQNFCIEFTDFHDFIIKHRS